MFGYPLQLFTDKNNVFNTKFSGLMSLILLIILANIFQSNAIQYINLQYVTSVVSQSQLSDPAEILMTSDNFMFAISLQQADYIFNERPYFNVTLQQKTYTIDQFGKKFKNFTYLVMEPCKLQKFQNIFGRYGKNFSDQYKKLTLDQWLCPVDDYQIRLGGVFTNDLFEFVKIEVTQCQNSSSTINSWNPSCAPNESVSNAKQHALSIYTTNYVKKFQNQQIVNSQDPDPTTFITPYLNDQLYFNFYPGKLFKSVDIYYREQDIVTDTSIFYGTNLQNDEIYYNDYQDFDERVDVLQGQIHSAFFFRRSIFTENVQRQFLKFADLLSYLGGFTGILLPLFNVFLQFYNKYACNHYNKQVVIIYLANKIYYFNVRGDGHSTISHSQIPQNQDNKSDNYQKKKQSTQNSFPENKASNFITNIFSNKQRSSMDPTKRDIRIKKQKLKLKVAVQSSFEQDQNPSQINFSIDSKNNPCNDEVYSNNIEQQSQMIIPMEDIKDNYDRLAENQVFNKRPAIFFQKLPIISNNKILDFSKIEADDEKQNLPLQKKGNQSEPNPPQEIKSVGILPSSTPQTGSFQAQMFKRIKVKLFGVVEKKQNEKKAHILKKNFTKLFEEFKSIGYTLKWVMNSISCRILFNNQYTKITNKTIDQIYKDLDVVKLIQKNHELRKLKQIILQEKQLLLFDIQPKKIIQMDEQGVLNLKDLKRLSQQKFIIFVDLRSFVQVQIEPEYQQIQEAYQWCMAESEKSNEYQSRYFLDPYSINNKLIEALGVELKSSLSQIQ